MSTNRDSVRGGGAAAARRNRKQYFCHQCSEVVTVTVPSSPLDEVACPACGGGFIEEYENPNPNPQVPRSSSSFSFTFSTNASGGGEFTFGDVDGDGDEPPFINPAEMIAAMFGGGQNVAAEEDVFNPMVFLQNYLNSRRAAGADIQFVFDHDGVGGGEFGLPGGNFGDYFFGPGLEQLIQQLAENDPNRYGTPPASKEAVEKLPDIKITEELMASDNAQCAVCMDAFDLGAKAKEMPCKHIYHHDCIMPWLELHNSCPVCRYELPTDDPEYEQRGAGGQNGTSAGGDSEDNSQARRYHIQLPWPFNSYGFGSDGSNSGGSGNGSQNSGGRSHQ